ncbi:MAG: SRPBCC family protein [Methyloceanibacter sp.]
MWRKILIALAAIVLIFVVMVAMQPSEFHVEKTATIDAVPAAVFAEVNDLKKWDAWSPWAKLDPDAKVSFEGPSVGEGATMAWVGNDKVGAGKMTVTESRPDDLVKLRVDFKEPFEGSSMSQFAFKSSGNQTAVTWTMTDDHNFLEKAFCLVMNGKKMIGNDMDKGLVQMKSVVEQQNKS